MNIELNEFQLLKMYDDLSREQQRLMMDIKNGTDSDYLKDNEKIISLLNNILIAILKLKNIKIQLLKKKEQL